VQLAAGIIAALVSGGDMWLNRFTRHGAAADGPVAHFARSLYVAISACTAVALLTLAVGGSWLWPGVEPYRKLIALGCVSGIAAGLGEVFFAVMRSRQRVVIFFGLRDVAVPAIFLILLIALRPAKAAGVLEIFCIVWLAVVALVAAIDYVGRSGQTHSGRTVPDRCRRIMLPLAVRHTLSIQAGNLLSRLAYLDVFVLSAIVPIAEVGLFRTAAQLAIGFVVVQHFIFLALPWQLRAARRASVGEQVLSHQRLLLVLSVVAFMALAVAAGPVLALFGERFTSGAWILRALLAVRFAGLLWGPQHELLISNGHVAADAASNLVVLAVWPALFFGLREYTNPLCAAVIATAFADAAVQGIRCILLHRYGVMTVRAHAGGVAFPLMMTAATAVGVWLAC